MSQGKLQYYSSITACMGLSRSRNDLQQTFIAAYARHEQSLSRLKLCSNADSIACSYASGFVFRTDGAQGVGVVNAMRGGTVAIVSHLCFCSPLRPLQCLTPLSAVSAAVVTAGGIIWVRSANPVKVRKHLTVQNWRILLSVAYLCRATKLKSVLTKCALAICR